MADIIPKEVLFNNGEGLTHDDLNKLQRRLQAYVADAVLGGYPMVTGVSAREYALQPSSGHQSILSYGNGGAIKPPAGFANRTVDFQHGLIGAPTGSSLSSNPADGETPSVLWYFMDADDVPDKTRPNISVNPRWDLLSVQLQEVEGDSESRDFKDAISGALSTQSFDKNKKVTATFTWTQGVEAATPVEPALPAGHFKLAAVQIVGDVSPTNDSGTWQIRDHRIPVGNKVYRIEAVNFKSMSATFGGATVTTVFSTFNGHFLQVSCGNNERVESVIPSPVCHANQRLRAVYIHGEPQTNGWELSVVNERSDYELWGVQTINGTFGDDLYTFTGDIEVPVWANGSPAGVWSALDSRLPQERRTGRLMLWQEWLENAHSSSALRYVAFDFWGL